MQALVSCCFAFPGRANDQTQIVITANRLIERWVPTAGERFSILNNKHFVRADSESQTTRVIRTALGCLVHVEENVRHNTSFLRWAIDRSLSHLSISFRFDCLLLFLLLLLSQIAIPSYRNRLSTSYAVFSYAFLAHSSIYFLFRRGAFLLDRSHIASCFDRSLSHTWIVSPLISPPRRRAQSRDKDTSWRYPVNGN